MFSAERLIGDAATLHYADSALQFKRVQAFGRASEADRLENQAKQQQQKRLRIDAEPIPMIFHFDKLEEHPCLGA